MTQQKWDVIVIGAGMAGLKAAAGLQQGGKSVVVLEARERIGGRIWTERTLTSIPIELGAELIHGDHAETWELVRAGKLRTVDVNRVHIHQHDDSWQPLSKVFNDSDNITLTDLPRNDESVMAYLTRHGIKREDWPAEVRLAELDIDSADRLSASSFVSRLSEGAETTADHYANYRVIGGYDNLVTQLANNLNIMREQIVTRINWSPGQVEVITSSGNVWAASAVVITLPIGVLKTRQISFNPDLPVEKWAAIDAMGVCDIVKLHLTFDQPVLDKSVDVIMDEKELPPVWWNASSGYNSYTGQVLVGWAVGDIARHFIASSEARAIEEAVASLRRLLKRPNLTPTFAHMKHWNDDPFTRGAYSYIPPGAADGPSRLAVPIADTLFFAGEATDKWYSTVHGAYRSGQRAASEVLKALKNSAR